MTYGMTPVPVLLYAPDCSKYVLLYFSYLSSHAFRLCTRLGKLEVISNCVIPLIVYMTLLLPPCVYQRSLHTGHIIYSVDLHQSKHQGHPAWPDNRIQLLFHLFSLSLSSSLSHLCRATKCCLSLRHTLFSVTMQPYISIQSVSWSVPWHPGSLWTTHVPQPGPYKWTAFLWTRERSVLAWTSWLLWLPYLV